MEMSGWVALLGAVVVSRIILERGYRQLSADEKIRLMDGFSATRAYSLIPLFALIAAFWLLSARTDIDRGLMATGYFSLLILYVVARVYFSRRKLIELQMPTDYRRTFSVVQAISLLGVAWFFFALLMANRF